MFFEEEKLRLYMTAARIRLEDIKKANGGKDRPTSRCTEPHFPEDACYGCDPYWRQLGKQ